MTEPAMDPDDIVTLFSGLSTKQYDLANVNLAATVSKMDSQGSYHGLMRYQRADSAHKENSSHPKVLRDAIARRPKKPLTI